MPRDEKIVLTQRVEKYIDYWRESLKDAESICPEGNRSSAMNKVMRGMKKLIGTYQVPDSANTYVKGNSSTRFNPDTKKFSSLLFPVSREVTTAEKMTIENCFDSDDKEGAAKLLRFIYMVEFEMSSLHYAIMIKEWLGDREIQLKSYISGRDGINKELESLSERFSELENSRENTEKVFFTHWSYMRDNSKRQRVEEEIARIDGIKAEVIQALNKEETADESVKVVKEILLGGIKSFQEGVNVVLLDSDKQNVVEVKKEQTRQKSAAAWEGLTSMFGSTKSTSGLAKSEIKSYQSDQMYPNARDYVSSLMKKLFYDYQQIDSMMNLFVERESYRQDLQRRIQQWHAGIDGIMKRVLDNEGKKKRIPELYYASMLAELRKSTTMQQSLCAELEEFVIRRHQLIADGNWEYEKNMRTTQKPEDCLKRENIARFRKHMSDYKSSSKKFRMSYAIINRVLSIGVFMGMTIIALKGALAMLPVSIQNIVLISKLIGILTIPTSLTTVILCVATVMIAINIRNVLKMKNSFKTSLNNFTINEEVNEEEEEASPEASYSQWLGRGFGSTFAFMNCFERCRNNQLTQGVVEEEGHFFGDERPGNVADSSQNGLSQPNRGGDVFDTQRQRSRSLESVDLSDDEGQGFGPGV